MIKHRKLVARLATSNISTEDFSYLTTVLMESRTCENCKHSEYFELSECPIDTEVWKRLNKKNFGCNLFVSTDIKSPQQD